MFKNQVRPYKSVLSLCPVFLFCESEPRVLGPCVPCGPWGAAAVLFSSLCPPDAEPRAGAWAGR